jgi:myosin-1
MGIFSLLNENSLLNKTDDEWLNSIQKQCTKFPQYLSWETKPTSREAGRKFKIKHYAGTVEYSIEGFISKNNDSLFQSTQFLMSNSRSELISQLFVADPNVNKAKRPPSIAQQFKVSVDTLIKKLMSCRAHYVRCIKPNDQKRSGIFTKEMVLNQVQYLGLKENIQVRQLGFVYNAPFHQFVHHYRCISKETFPKLSAAYAREGKLKDACAHLIGLASSDSNALQLGHTKVFIKSPETIHALEEMRERKLSDIAKVIQTAFRRYEARKMFIELKKEINILLKGKKERRRCSIFRNFMGDYLELRKNINITKLLQKYKENKVLYSGMIEKVNKRNKVQERSIMISEQTLYTMVISGAKIKLKRRLALRDIASVTISPYTDGFFVLEFPKNYDYLIRSDDLTEVLSILVRTYRQLVGRDLVIKIEVRFQYRPSKKEKKTVTFFKEKQEGKQAYSLKILKDQLNISVQPEAIAK